MTLCFIFKQSFISRVNHLDIAPQHASVTMGISNTFGTIPGIVSPTLTGFIVQNKVSFSRRIAFVGYIAKTHFRIQKYCPVQYLFQCIFSFTFSRRMSGESFSWYHLVYICLAVSYIGSGQQVGTFLKIYIQWKNKQNWNSVQSLVYYKHVTFT